MDLLKNMHERRMPQYISAYCIGGFGLVRFVEFLEGRMQFSPHWVNLTVIALLCLLPAVALLAWSQGRPGKDHWGRLEKIAIPANLVLTIVTLLFVFHGKDLGGITTTVAVADENGQVSERVVPKSAFCKRVILYAFDNAGPADQDWLRFGLPLMLDFDLSQDPFIDGRQTSEMIGAVRNAGYPEGVDIPRALQRKLARESHFPFFLTGIVQRTENSYVIETELHGSDNGRVLAKHEFQGPDISALVDELSLQLRRDLDLPASHIDEQVDVAVAEILSEDIDAISIFSRAAIEASVHNRWDVASELSREAVKLDPTFAMAQFILSTSCSLLGGAEESTTAINAAMANLYRLPERLQLQIKAIYYLNAEQDADKGMAVVEMWTQLYPHDTDALILMAYLYLLRNDRSASIAAYETALDINPHRYELLHEIGNLHQELGEFSKAEEYLRQYAERFPTSIQSWSKLADLYLDFGELTLATETLERALLIEPQHIATRLSLADIAAKEGKFAKANDILAQLRSEAKTTQSLFDVLDQQMSLCNLQGQIIRSQSFLDEFVDCAQELYNPIEVNVIHAVHLRCSCDIGRPEESLAALENLVESTAPPVDRMVAYFKFSPLIDLNRLDETEVGIDDTEELVEQLKIEIWRPRIADARGQLAVARSDYASAEEQFRSAVDLNPTSPRTQRWLGRVLRLQGKFDEAEEVLNQLLRIDPNNGKTNLELAQLYSETDKLTKAREHLRIALHAWQDADPEFIPAIEAREMQSILGSLP